MDHAHQRRRPRARHRYSRLIAALDKANIALNRKMLADIAISDPIAFKKVVETARAAYRRTTDALDRRSAFGMSSATRALIASLDRLAGGVRGRDRRARDEQAIRAAQAQFLGKKGKVSELMKELGKLPPADRPAVGAAANKVKQSDRARGRARLAELADAAATADLARTVDVTLPARPVARRPPAPAHAGAARGRCRSSPSSASSSREGPQIETDWHTFEALAIPQGSSRARHAGHVLRRPTEIVLRTHTSPVQVRTMLTQAAADPDRRARARLPPRRRPHAHPDVHADRGARRRRGHLVRRPEGRRCSTSCTASSGATSAIRLRPSYFPFVEPGGRGRHAVQLLRRRRRAAAAASARAPAGSRSAARAWSTPTCSRSRLDTSSTPASRSAWASSAWRCCVRRQRHQVLLREATSASWSSSDEGLWSWLRELVELDTSRDASRRARAR